MVTIQKCSCKSEFQDQRYGKGLRAFNTRVKGDPSCTVCGIPIKHTVKSKHASNFKDYSALAIKKA